MRRVGIDIGSRYVKIARHDAAGRLILEKHDSARFYREYGRATPEGFVIDMESLGLGDYDEVVATGYGRERAKLAGATEIPEIQAHAIGVSAMLGIDTFTLVDFGGQDTKVIRVENGLVVDFLTSDRCAASTGRFIENMARVLGLTVDEISQYYENPAPITSTCAVFAETELLEKLSLGYTVESLAAGVNKAIVKRFAALIRRFPTDRVAASGGVAKNTAVIKFLSETLGTRILIPEHPQFAGAIGCLRYGEVALPSQG
ncbi:MAG TPA: 2-hydroxyglutaryl-CoA dehydratase [candidate division Zixibacteria bacterium]|nr:2-hydroxyglutaryl-CoA dehydratase [candidate division Zixibacteria bacterium]